MPEYVKVCPGGGIGRHTGLRSQRQKHESSSLSLGTKSSGFAVRSAGKRSSATFCRSGGRRLCKNDAPVTTVRHFYKKRRANLHWRKQFPVPKLVREMIIPTLKI